MTTARVLSLTPKQRRAEALRQLEAAAIEYDAHSNGGRDPLGAGARLRLVAKAYARAMRSAGELP